MGPLIQWTSILRGHECFLRLAAVCIILMLPIVGVVVFIEEPLRKRNVSKEESTQTIVGVVNVR